MYEENSEKELETRGSRVGRRRGQEAPDSTRCSPAGPASLQPAGPGPSLASPVPWPCRGGVLRVVPDTRPRRHRSEPGREWSEWEGSVGGGLAEVGKRGSRVGRRTPHGNALTREPRPGRPGSGSWSAREGDRGLPQLRRKLGARGFTLQVRGLQAGESPAVGSQRQVTLRPAPTPGCPFGCRTSMVAVCKGGASQADALGRRGAHGGGPTSPLPQASAPSATAVPSAAAFVWEEEQGRPSCSSLTSGCESTSPTEVPAGMQPVAGPGAHLHQPSGRGTWLARSTPLQ